MCGRVIRTSSAEVLRQTFDLASLPDDLRDRYNLAPTDPIPVIRSAPAPRKLLRWGLKMSDGRMAGVNVRVESLSRPIYRDNVRDRRCLVIVDGFYEWRAIGGKKFPYVIAREDKAPMALAGIYDANDCCAILTAKSQGIVATLHDRMPVMLADSAFATWLDRRVKDVRPLLAATTADGLICYPVSRAVNSVKNDDARLLERVPDPECEPPRGSTLPLFGAS